MKYEATLERFLDDVKDHELTVRLDQGVYRDMTFSKPDSSAFHFNITTRSGYLFFTGDMGSFTFKRLPDMFDFFRNKDQRINPQYWAEKCEAENTRNGIHEYSPRMAKERALQYLTDFLESLDSEDEGDQACAEEAKNATFDLQSACDNYHELIIAYNEWDDQDAGGMDLDDFFEGGLNDFTFHYIWALRAIVHVINIYDKQIEEKANAVEPSPIIVDADSANVEGIRRV